MSHPVELTMLDTQKCIICENRTLAASRALCPSCQAAYNRWQLDGGRSTTELMTWVAGRVRRYERLGGKAAKAIKG